MLHEISKTESHRYKYTIVFTSLSKPEVSIEKTISSETPIDHRQLHAIANDTKARLTGKYNIKIITSERDNEKMVFNTRKDTPLRIDKCYYSRNGGKVVVKKIVSIQNNRITYKRIYGRPAKLLNSVGECSIITFRNWMNGEIGEDVDFSSIEGATIYPTYLVYNTKGIPIFRCFQRRARFYLKRNFAIEIGNCELQLTEKGAKTEEMLIKRYGDLSHLPFFMAVKNDKCVVCGSNKSLTSHHIIPKRLKNTLPIQMRKELSNVLYICSSCHERYERHIEKQGDFIMEDPESFVIAWRDDFINTMNPKYLPAGWDIFVQNYNHKKINAA